MIRDFLACKFNDFLSVVRSRGLFCLCATMTGIEEASEIESLSEELTGLFARLDDWVLVCSCA